MLVGMAPEYTFSHKVSEKTDKSVVTTKIHLKIFNFKFIITEIMVFEFIFTSSKYMIRSNQPLINCHIKVTDRRLKKFN